MFLSDKKILVCFLSKKKKKKKLSGDQKEVQPMDEDEGADNLLFLHFIHLFLQYHRLQFDVYF